MPTQDCVLGRSSPESVASVDRATVCRGRQPARQNEHARKIEPRAPAFESRTVGEHDDIRVECGGVRAPYAAPALPAAATRSRVPPYATHSGPLRPKT